MYTIEKEIFSQPEAMKQTKDYLSSRKEELQAFLKKPKKRILFIGSGSSYMLGEGAAQMFNLYTETPSYALSGGEILLHPDKYRTLFENALIIIASRSGETSEVLFTIQKMKEACCFQVLGIIAKTEYPLKPYVDFSIELPWAFDNSVCQTRTISNIYYSLTSLMICASADKALEDVFDNVLESQTEFLNTHRTACQDFAAHPWNNVTTLGDGELCGIVNEGGLAFSEICMLPGEYFKLLDYRHGPIVLVDSSKLVLAVLDGNNANYQKDIIADIKSRGGYVITFSPEPENIWGSDWHIGLPDFENPIAWGIPFINICQMLAFYKALANGHNPDEPEGLNSFVALS